jgi:hypothetical protein
MQTLSKPMFNFGSWLNIQKKGAANKYLEAFKKTINENDFPPGFNITDFLNTEKPKNFLSIFPSSEMTPDEAFHWKTLRQRWLNFLTHNIGIDINAGKYNIYFTYMNPEHQKKMEALRQNLKHIAHKSFQEELV